MYKSSPKKKWSKDCSPNLQQCRSHGDYKCSLVVIFAFLLRAHLSVALYSPDTAM